MLPILPIVAAIVATLAVARSTKRRHRNASGALTRRPGAALRKRTDRTKRTVVMRRLDALAASMAEKRSIFFGDGDLVTEDRRLTLQLALAVVGLGVALVGSVTTPPFAALSLAFLAYPVWPYVTDGYHAIVHQRRINMAAVDILMVGGLVVARQWIALAILGAMLALSRKLISHAEDRSQRKVVDVFTRHRETVWVLVNGTEVEVPFDQVVEGDRILARAGEVIVADGIVETGTGTVDQSLLTGETRPVEKTLGDTAFAATTVLTGSLLLRVIRSGEATTAGRVAHVLNNTADYRRRLQWRWMQFIDGMAVPSLASGAAAWIVLGPAAAIPMMFSVGDFGYSMRVAAPLQLFRFLQKASLSSVLIKDGRVFERVPDIDTVVFDKTGTLTLDRPHLHTIHAFGEMRADDILAVAASAEQYQWHPIAQTILAEAAVRNIGLTTPQDSQVALGLGLSARIGEQSVTIGSTRFMTLRGLELPDTAAELAAQSDGLGHSIVWVATDGAIVGAIELKPALRPEAADVIEQLKRLGLTIYILSGDRAGPTQHLADRLAIHGCFAEILPEGKAEVVGRLQTEGRKVCFIGAGIDDSLALRKADIAVSMRGATTIAVETAQVILTDHTLAPLPTLFTLSQHFKRDMRRSLFLTATPSVLAAGGIALLNIGMIPVILLSYTGMGLGVAQAGLPLLTDRPVRLRRIRNRTCEPTPKAALS